MTKKILITGGAGFLGSHLSEKLLSDGHYVHCIDNFHTGSLDNIKHIIDDDNFSFQNHDVINPIGFNEKYDCIYNLACPASPIHYQYDPIKTVKTSFLGAMNILEYAQKHNARVLQASTSEVYGDPLEHPQREVYQGNVNPIGIRACYDEGKRVAETIFFDFQRQHSVEVKIVRIFNTYGPRLAINDGRVVSNFIHQALNGRDITAHGDGSQTRSFCYVDDLITGLIAMMDSEESVHGPINLGNPTEITITQLAETIIDLTHSSSEVIFKPLPQDDPVKRKPDITMAKKFLDWEPQVSLEEGLTKTISYFKEML